MSMKAKTVSVVLVLVALAVLLAVWNNLGGGDVAAPDVGATPSAAADEGKPGASEASLPERVAAPDIGAKLDDGAAETPVAKEKQPEPAKAPAGFALHGRVVTQNNKLVAGCRVTCSWPGTNRLVRTDEHGRFTIANCTEQLVSFRVEGDGIERLHQAGVDPGAGDVELRVQAVGEPTATITGVVQDPLGQPLGQLEVKAGRRGQSILDRIAVTTAADGRFTFTPLVPGDWYLTIATEDHPELGKGPVVVGANDVQDVGVLRLAIGGTLQATVRGGDAAGERFRVRRQDGEPSGGSTEHDGGVLQSSLLNAGAYNLTVTGNGTAAQTIAFAIKDNEVTRFDVTLQQGVPQQFEVVVPARAPKGEAIRLRIMRGSELVIAKLVSRATGAPRPPIKANVCVAAGDYKVVVTCGAMTVSQPISVGTQEGPVVRVSLQ